MFFLTEKVLHCFLVLTLVFPIILLNIIFPKKKKSVKTKSYKKDQNWKNFLNSIQNFHENINS